MLTRQATALMAKPAQPVTAIALDLSYSDPAHFTRAFARWTGQPPQRWRRMAMRRQDK